MMRFGYVIRTGGDPEISGALVSGIRQATPAGPRASEEVIRRLAMQRHTPEELRQMMQDARREYARPVPAPRWAERLLALYALLCWCVSKAYHYPEELVRRCAG